MIIYFLILYFQIQEKLKIKENDLYNQKRTIAIQKEEYSKNNISSEIKNDYKIKFYNDCESLIECEKRLVIKGDKECNNGIDDALKLLQLKSFDEYYYVVKYIGFIHCEDKGSGIYSWYDPPEVILGQASIDGGTIWLAGSLVHEACHSYLYRNYIIENSTISIVPKEIYSGEKAEQICLDKQYKSLENIGADQQTLDHIKNSINTKYWEVEYKDRWW